MKSRRENRPAFMAAISARSSWSSISTPVELRRLGLFASSKRPRSLRLRTVKLHAEQAREPWLSLSGARNKTARSCALLFGGQMQELPFHRIDLGEIR